MGWGYCRFREGGSGGIVWSENEGLEVLSSQRRRWWRYCRVHNKKITIVMSSSQSGNTHRNKQFTIKKYP